MPWSFLSSPLRLSVPIGVFSKKDDMFFKKTCHGHFCRRLSTSPSRSACFLEKMLCFLENMPWSFQSSPLRLSVPIGVFSKKDFIVSRKHAMVISVVASPPLRPDRRVF